MYRARVQRLDSDFTRDPVTLVVPNLDFQGWTPRRCGDASSQPELPIWPPLAPTLCRTLVPVCFAVDGDTVYSAVDHKPKRGTQLRRLDNLRATGLACLLVDQYGEDWSMLWWVRLDGRGRVTDNPREVALALAALGDKYHQYAGQPPGGPIIAIQVTRWSGWSAAG